MKSVGKAITLLGLAVCAAAAAVPAQADFVSGAYARQAGMGGAGLAIIDQPTSAHYSNPAALAYSRKKWGFNFPSASVRYEGTSFADARRMREEAVGLTGDDVRRLALTFAKQDSTLDVHSVAGITALRQNIGYEVQGRVRAEPDAALRAWAGNPVNLLTGATSRLTAASVLSAPSVSLGSFVPGYSNGRLAVGGRVRFQHLTGRLQTVTFTDEDGNGTVTDIETENKNGMAVDVGMLLEPKNKKGTSLAFVADNVVHPSFRSFGQETMISFGAAQTLADQRLVAAADVVNLTNAYGDGVDLRAGLEFKPVSYFALRAGVASKTGLTVGVQLAGFNFAWAGDSPMVVNQTLRF